jgi:hypothetical protein
MAFAITQLRFTNPLAFGQGISFPGVQTAGLHGLGPQDAGLGSAVQNTSLQLGGSLGLAGS